MAGRRSMAFRRKGIWMSVRAVKHLVLAALIAGFSGSAIAQGQPVAHKENKELPPERFGAWSLEHTIYGEPHHPWEGPNPKSKIRLTSATSDGILRWSIETEGWRLDVSTRRKDKMFNSLTFNQIADLPDKPDVLIRLLRRHLRLFPGLTLATSREPADPKAKKERLRQAVLVRKRYEAELAASAPDLQRAIKAMRARITEHYGELSNAKPCLPPRCIH
jgi:hypothetical protein